MTGESSSQAVQPLVLEAFVWGLLSAISLNIGSLIGVLCLPPQKVRAVLMSFGGGALLFALSIELFGNVLTASKAAGRSSPVWVMESSAILGGLFFAALNYVLNVMGADVRKRSTTKSRVARLRALLMRRLAWRLLRIPFFSVLEVDQLKDLIQAAMCKERFCSGDVIMSGEPGDHHGIYFILSGHVKVKIRGAEDRGMKDPLAPLQPAAHESGLRRLGLPSLARVRSGSLLTADTHPTDEAKDDSSGDETRDEWILGPNQIFGDMTVLTGSYIRAAAEAVTPVKVLALPGHEVSRLLEQNAEVREEVALRAVRRLRELAELQDLAQEAISALSTRCELVCYRPGDIVFQGPVDATTSLLNLVLGTVEVVQVEGSRRTLHAGCLLCAEHFRSRSTLERLSVKALAPVSILRISRSDLDEVTSAASAALLLDVSVSSDDEIADVPVPGQVRQAPTMHLSSTSESTDMSPRASSKKPQFPSPFRGRSKSKEAVRIQVTPPRKDAWEDDSGGVGARLGWEPDGSGDELEEHVPLGLQIRMNSTSFGQVTDHELAEQEHFLAATRRSISKRSSMSQSASVEPSRSEGGGDDARDAASEQVEGHHGLSAAKHRAIMVWLGILIDAVPESLVIGIIINKSAVGAAEGENLQIRAAAAALPFVIGVFISNLPESMSSSGSMKAHGMKVSTILAMWLGTTLLTACGSALGALLFPPGAAGGAVDSPTALTVTAVEGLAAGAMLTMIAQTMMPEAFEQGGDIVGVSCLVGFLIALSVKLVPLGAPPASH